MVVIVCVDKKNGMLFNHRRQSQDRALRARILTLTAQSKLRMNEYSAKQFKEPLPSHVVVGEDFLSLAGPNDFCFVENTDLTPYESKVERLILYHWNREYPADTFFPLDLSQFSLQSTREFSGSSHETITEEVYTR
ncbi:MAG: ribonuclease Z [Ruminiclostridium sp.]|nr:ribonuclease Z [Ruminiclostridium sp.]